MATVTETGAKQRALNALNAIEREYSEAAGGMAEVATNMLRGWIETISEEKMVEEMGKLHTLLGVIINGE